MPGKNVWVEYELDEEDIEDFSDSELRKECARRGWNMPPPPVTSEERHPLHEIYYAMKFGLNDRAFDLMRAHVCEELGVVL